MLSLLPILSLSFSSVSLTLSPSNFVSFLLPPLSLSLQFSFNLMKFKVNLILHYGY